MSVSLGFGPKNPNKMKRIAGIQLAPTPQVSGDPKLILPHPIFHPTFSVEHWREVVRMQAKQGAGPGAGSGRNVGVGGTAAALGKRGREGGSGRLEGCLGRATG